MSDAKAAFMAFSEWCRECGYDYDSRSAYETYKACVANGHKLLKILPAQEVYDGVVLESHCGSV